MGAELHGYNGGKSRSQCQTLEYICKTEAYIWFS